MARREPLVHRCGCRRPGVPRKSGMIADLRDTATDPAVWTARAKALCERALSNFDEVDPQPDLGAAVACLRVAEGALDASELAGFPFPGEPDATAVCTCPVDLL